MFNNARLADFSFDYKNDILGKGKHGHVYKVTWKRDFQIYALKLVFEEKDDNSQIININREYNIMSNINHPNIEKIYGGFKDFNPIENKYCYCFVLEFINGENLTNFMERYKLMKQEINQKLIIIILKGVLNGLDYLHKQNILHRDITTDNIMIEKDSNNIKITDFGISAYYKQYNYQQSFLYCKQSIVGRPDFVSPEIFNAYINGINPVYDFKTDIYSLGIVMFRLMTFCFPSRLKNRNLKINFADNIDPNKYDQSLINIIMKMLEEKPDNRPSCQEVYNSLEFLDPILSTKIKTENLLNINGNESCFSCIMKCLSHIDSIYNYLVANDRIRNKKKLSDKSFIVIKSFIEVLEKIKKNNSLKNDFINNLINNASQKILFFQDNDDLTPKTILEGFYNYFLTNLPKIFIFNNTVEHKLGENRNQNPEFFYINQKIEEFKEEYKNIFVETFYFLVLKIYICPQCSSVIKQDLDIEWDIEFFDKGNIKELFKGYLDKKEISNTIRNSLTCSKCDITSQKIFEIKNFYTFPQILIINFNSFSILDEFLTINQNDEKEQSYALKAIIFSNQIATNKNLYEIAIKINGEWNYISNKETRILCFKDIIKRGDIRMAFYEVDSNEFKLFN